MAELFVVVEHGGEYDSSYSHDVKAFLCPTKAELFRMKLEQDWEIECQLVEQISEWYDEFVQSFPEPKMQHVEYQEDPAKSFEENSAEYEAQCDFLGAVYEEAHRQAYNEWFEIWYSALEGKLAAIGAVPFSESRNITDVRCDYRNFGMPRDRRGLRFSINTLELEE